MTSKQEQYERLRKLFNSAIRGPNTDAVLWALANPAVDLINNIEAVHDNVYISTAIDRYLDQRLADYNLIRPPQVGLSDDIFRQIGISVINKKQVRELLTSILGIVFGEELTQATAKSSQLEPYNLDDGDLLKIKFDAGNVVEVRFNTSDFTNISSASAQEVADAITKSLRSQGKTGRAFAKDDGLGGYVVLASDTEGPQSSVAVYGGRAQNELVFEKVRPTTAGASTQWTVTAVSGGLLRFTWSGGPNPSVGKIRIGDYVNIFGSGFSAVNQGTFNIVDVKGGIVNSAYFEIENPAGVGEIVVQGTSDDVLFFQPFKNSISTKTRYAAIFQEESRLLEVFIPATTRVVRRERKGAAHLREPFLTTETYSAGTNQIVDIGFPAKSAINDGDYFLINSANNNSLYYVYLSTVVSGGGESTAAVNTAFDVPGIFVNGFPGDVNTGGQTFMSASAGNLTRIVIPMYREDAISGTTKLLIYRNPVDISNLGTFLGESDTINISSIDTVLNNFQFNFSTPIPLNTTDTYLFLMDGTNISTPGPTDRLRVQLSVSGNPYAAGAAVSVNGWPTPYNYTIYDVAPVFDWVFEVFVSSSVTPLDPAIPGRTGIPVDISSAVTSTDVAVAVSNTLNGNSNFNSYKPTSNISRICWSEIGVTDVPVNGNISGLTISQVQAGVDSVSTTTTVANPSDSLPDQEGPYTYDLSQPFVLSDIGTELSSELSPDSGRVVSVADSSQFPDEQGSVIIGYGTDRQEGPIPYLARPSNSTLLLSPAYKVVNTHPSNSEVRLVSQLGPANIDKVGRDFPAYLTDIVAGRNYVEDLIKEVAATGINLVITILYPGDEGLSKWGTENSDKVAVWGGDSDV